MNLNQGKPSQSPSEPQIDLAAVRDQLQGGQPVDANVTLGLLQLLLLRETRAAEAEKAVEKQRAAKEEGRRLNSITFSQDMIRKQKTCKHLKGGKTRKANQTEDYNVYFHRFIHGVQWIKCNSCSAKWFPEDTKEFYVRGKRSYVNHTGIGWAEARLMAAKSSNQPSSSEMPMLREEAVEAPKTESGEVASDVQF